MNTVLSDVTEDVRLASPLGELFIGYRIGLLHILDSPEGARIDAMDARNECIAERLRLGALYYQR